MKLKQLQYFRSLAKNLHYSATADELNIAQPTLSRVISQLESDLDVCLFEKQGRCIELTKHGKIFLEHIEKALYEIELAEKIIYESKNNQNDIIDLGFIFSLGYEYIPKLVKKFLNENINFDCSFNFYQGDTLELLTKLKARECDLVLCSYICNEPEIEFHQVLTQELVIIASKNHPISQLNSIALKDVSKYSFILPLDKAFYIESLFDDMGLKLNTLCRVQEDSSIIGLVSENCGISILDKNYSLYRENISVLEIEDKCETQVYLATLKKQSLSPVANELKSFILKQKNVFTGYNEIE